MRVLSLRDPDRGRDCFRSGTARANGAVDRSSKGGQCRIGMQDGLTGRVDRVHGWPRLSSSRREVS